jgi:purine-nucleoside phosphorylase
MSTVNEVIMANALGMNVLGLTLAANESGAAETTHESVLAEATRHADDFERLVRGIIRLL